MAERETLPVAGARAGEPEAWDILFKRYQLPLYVYAFELVHDEQTSLDIVQETFIAATRHIAWLRNDSKFGSWLFGIAHQKCIQRWRKQDLDDALCKRLGAEPSGSEAGPDEFLIREEEEERVMNLLNQLPAPQRSALLLHVVEDFALEEIAQITGTTVGTVKSRLHYAKKAMRKLLEENLS